MQYICRKARPPLTLVAIASTSEATHSSVKASLNLFLTDSQGQTEKKTRMKNVQMERSVT